MLAEFKPKNFFQGVPLEEVPLGGAESTAIQLPPIPIPKPKKFRSLEDRPQRMGTMDTIIDLQKGHCF